MDTIKEVIFRYNGGKGYSTKCSEPNNNIDLFDELVSLFQINNTVGERHCRGVLIYKLDISKNAFFLVHIADGELDSYQRPTTEYIGVRIDSKEADETNDIAQGLSFIVSSEWVADPEKTTVEFVPQGESVDAPCGSDTSYTSIKDWLQNEEQDHILFIGDTHNVVFTGKDKFSITKIDCTQNESQSILHDGAESKPKEKPPQKTYAGTIMEQKQKQKCSHETIVTLVLLILFIVSSFLSCYIMYIQTDKLNRRIDTVLESIENLRKHVNDIKNEENKNKPDGHVCDFNGEFNIKIQRVSGDSSGEE